MTMEQVPILLYHDLDSPELPSVYSDPARRQTIVRLAEFRAQMEWLARHGYRGVSVREYLDEPAPRRADRRVVLTFDDGHASNSRLALGVLREHAFTASFFVVAGWIGRADYMGASELRGLARAGMEIGSHGLTHAPLAHLDLASLRREVLESKGLIEQTLGSPVEAFAYPGGFQNSHVVAAVRAAGYTRALSCLVGRNDPSTNRFLLRRIEIRRGTSREAFGRAVTGRGLLLHRGANRGKALLRELLGAERYGTLRRQLFFLYPFSR